MRLLSLLLVGISSLLPIFSRQAKNYILPNLTNQSIDIDSSPFDGALDRAYIYPGNGSSYEWWYFDAVASDHSASIVVVALVLPPPVYLDLVVQIIWPNGTVTDIDTTYNDTKLYVSTRGDGSNGALGNGAFVWTGEPDLGRYDLKVDLPDCGIKGDIKLISAAPPHVADGPIGPDSTSQTWWYFNWLDLVPDAVATVDITVGEDKLAFVGNGYHDKNWGPVPYQLHVNQWYWGHGRAGDYSLVWAYMLDNSGLSKGLSYIARNSEILFLSSTTDDSITVRPFGPDVTYPIVGSGSSKNIKGFEIVIKDEYKFTFEQTSYAPEKTGQYARWIGSMTGGHAGEEDVTGAAVMELMGPFDLSANPLVS